MLSNYKIAPRRAVVVLGVLAVSCAITACGSSSGGSSSTTASGSATASASSATGRAARRAALVACLKQHGVTLPARPPGSSAPGSGAAPGSGRGFFGGGGFLGGGGFRNSKFAAAFRACAGKLGFRGGRPGRFRLSHAAIEKFVACVRRHGYSLPSPNFSGKWPGVPGQHPHQQEVPGRQSRLRERAAPGGRRCGRDEYDGE